MHFSQSGDIIQYEQKRYFTAQCFEKFAKDEKSSE